MCDSDKLPASIKESNSPLGASEQDSAIFGFDKDWPSELNVSNLARQTSSEPFDDVRIFWHVTAEMRAAEIYAAR